jgi:hypothetical protein
MEVFCTTCGQGYVNNERFCKRCGTALSQPNQAQNPPGQANTMPTQVLSNQVPPVAPVQPTIVVEAPKQSSFGSSCIGLLILGSLVLCCVFGVIVQSSNPSQNPSNNQSASNNRQAAQSSQNVSLPTATAEPTRVSEISAKTLRTANLRSLPKAGDKEPVIGRLSEDTPIRIYGRNEAKDWFVVETPRGLNGWLSATLVDDYPESVIDKLPVISSEEPLLPSVRDHKVIMTAWNIEFQNTFGELKADDGYVFFLVSVRLENISGEDLSYGPLNFTLNSTNGYLYQAPVYVALTPESLNESYLEDGESVNGVIFFDLPKDASGLTLNYEPIIPWTEYKKISIPLTEE